MYTTYFEHTNPVVQNNCDSKALGGIMFTVIICSYLILKKMNERITDSYNISTHKHIERINIKYIPSYISENGV